MSDSNILADRSNRDKEDNGYGVGNREIARIVSPKARNAGEWSVLLVIH